MLKWLLSFPAASDSDPSRRAHIPRRGSFDRPPRAYPKWYSPDGSKHSNVASQTLGLASRASASVPGHRVEPATLEYSRSSQSHGPQVSVAGSAGGAPAAPAAGDVAEQLHFLVQTVQSLAAMVVDVDRKVSETPQLVLERIDAFLKAFHENPTKSGGGRDLDPPGRPEGRPGGSNSVKTSSSQENKSAFSLLLPRASEVKRAAGEGNGHHATGKKSISLTNGPPLLTFSNIRPELGDREDSLLSKEQDDKHDASFLQSGRMQVNVTRGYPDLPLISAQDVHCGSSRQGQGTHEGAESSAPDIAPDQMSDLRSSYHQAAYTSTLHELTHDSAHGDRRRGFVKTAKTASSASSSADPPPRTCSSCSRLISPGLFVLMLQKVCDFACRSLLPVSLDCLFLSVVLTAFCLRVCPPPLPSLLHTFLGSFIREAGQFLLATYGILLPAAVVYTTPHIDFALI